MAFKKNRASANMLKIFVVFTFPFLLTVLIIYRAVEFQIIKRDELQKRLLKQRERIVKLVPRRGRILDARKNEIAVSVKVGSVFVRPKAIKEPEQVARILSKTLDMDIKEVNKILRTGQNFVWVKRQIPEGQAEELSRQRIPGVEVVWEYKRYYPNRELAASVIGFTGWDSQGLEGLEFYFDSYLQSEADFLYTEKDAYGQEILLEPTIPALSGNDIVLTIDTGIQFVVEEELKKVGEATKAKNVIAIVMDVRSGEILAMAQYPNFNPNSFKNYPPLRWRNLSVSGIYEPGSTFKVFLVAAALQNGIIKPDTVFNCENGEYRISNEIVIHDVKKYTYLTVEDIIAYSSNIGAAKIASLLGKGKYMDYINEFGFGKKTGIELAAEEKGIVRTVAQTTDIDNMIMGFGQGISVTPIQLITAFNAIVNDGVLVKPFIVKSILSPEGNVIYSYLPQEGKRIVSEKVARQVKRMLAKVVDSGTGKSANIEGYGSAGKTGTSQKIDPATGSYSLDRFTSYFIGYTPLKSPRVSILVIVDEPEGVAYGGIIAAPAFKAIGERILPMLNVESEFTVSTNTLRITEENQAEKTIQNFDEQALVPGFDGKRMPDLRGLSYREALKVLSRYGIRATLKGNGFVEKQTPQPGAVIDSDSNCSVVFSPLI
jgi:cell division protein FtsI (penicillin-binding protein 3)